MRECESGEDGKCVGSQMWDCEGWELWGWETWPDKISSAGGADGAGAWHITARHRMDMALRHLGCHMGIIVKFSEALRA